MGSGSVGVGAISEGFNFIGCENDIEHGYFDMAVERLWKARTLLE